MQESLVDMAQASHKLKMRIDHYSNYCEYWGLFLRSRGNIFFLNGLKRKGTESCKRGTFPSRRAELFIS